MNRSSFISALATECLTNQSRNYDNGCKCKTVARWNILLGLRIMKWSKSDNERMPWIRPSSSTTTSRWT